MPLGLYISVPFCRTKCTYCNFASDVFPRTGFEKYATRLCAEVEHANETAAESGGLLEHAVDSIYFGGGTPTLLDVTQLEAIFVTIRQNFKVQPNAEITVECAPGTLSEPLLDGLVDCGTNRVSLGVQSFVDREAGSVARLHKRTTVLDDIESLRSAGISNINIDLIAGLPHQTRQSWDESLVELIATGVPHASIYMLEVDEDSRLGRELIAGGQRYHAHFVPDEDLTADLYEIACERLERAGVEQYEISNFARTGFESKHNLKYWTRQPYLGFGVDAHSMLDSTSGHGVVRFSNAEAVDKYVAGARQDCTWVNGLAALEETLFLGLRLNRGLNLEDLAQAWEDELSPYREIIGNLCKDGLIELQADRARLTRHGRLLSNEVFEQLILVEGVRS
jgi:oxygen-independent coproporphyrinogen III oxidase